MADAPASLCREPGCPEKTRDGHCPAHAEGRVGAGERAGLYQTARWRRMREFQLEREPNCAECGEPATVADHIEPHRGRVGLFFDMDNLQSMCDGCHGAKSGSERESGPRYGGGR